jgi:hypothetical protein
MLIKNKNKQCLIVKCNKSAYCKGYCTKHYQQLRLTGKIKQEKPYLEIQGLCINLGCSGKPFAKGLCQKCYRKQRVMEQ